MGEKAGLKAAILCPHHIGQFMSMRQTSITRGSQICPYYDPASKKTIFAALPCTHIPDCFQLVFYMIMILGIVCLLEQFHCLLDLCILS